MKRSIIIEVVAIAEIVAFFAIIFLYFIITNNILPIWFSLGCFFIGVWCLLKAYYFNLDSSFLLGSLLVLVSSVGLLIFLKIILQTVILPAYILCFALASALCGIKFYKKNIYYKISFFLTLEDLWILLYSVSVINLAIALILCVLTLTLFWGGKYVFKRGKRLQ